MFRELGIAVVVASCGNSGGTAIPATTGGADKAPPPNQQMTPPKRDHVVINGLEEITIDYRYTGWSEVQRTDHVRRDGAKYLAGSVEVPRALVDALANSLTGLTPSDTLKTASDHTDDYPRFAVTLQTSTGVVEVSSTSNARAFAPWNVIAGGKLYMQSNGAFGDALAKVLRVIDPAVWPERTHAARAASFRLLEGEAPAKTVVTAPPLRDHYRALVEGFAEVRAQFSGPLAVSDVWCDTDKNPNCDRIRITVQTPLVTDVVLEFVVETDGDAFVALKAPADASARALASSALVRALLDVSVTRPLAISMHDDDCEFVRRILASAPAGTSTGTCTYLFVSAAGRDGDPPSVFYFSAASLAWLRAGRGDAHLAFYRSLGADAKTLADLAATPLARWWYSSLDGKLASSAIR